jgi:pimeloyl-ACP methyl ester carboxylesterase
MRVQANGIDIEVQDSATSNAAHRQRPAVLLIMGLGMQLVAWPKRMVQALVDAGYRVICFDNRDSGLSTHMVELGKPPMAWTMLKLQMGMAPQPLYSLFDMAQDAWGVLDALYIAQAHVVGVSMGGMIAQRMAIDAPGRVLSLSSIMSTSGARSLPQPERQVLQVLMEHPASLDEDVIMAHYLRMFRTIGSPAYPQSEEVLRAQILLSLRRSYDPMGTQRQMLAVMCDVHRAGELGRITSPTLVVHGRSDPLVPFACGEDTARRIPGAQLMAIDGMGHDLPPEPVERILQCLLPHLQFSTPIQPVPQAPL